MLSAAARFLLSCILLLSGLAFPATAQEKKPVVITFGQPNIWSLEQAHYLLARMRFQSLDLESKKLTEADLDPNLANGSRVETLKSLLGIGVSFDQGVGLQNERFQRNIQFNDTRRQELIAARDLDRSRLLNATSELSKLKVERAGMNLKNSGATDETKAVKDAEIEAKNTEIDLLKTRIGDETTELSSLTAAPTAPTPAPTPPDIETSKLAERIMDKLVTSADFQKELSRDPQLNASTKLENMIQLQYEIIAKQLTLLRDEVGPGERLVFLELPQSIYTVPDKANRRLAQAWWHVNGYYKTETAPAADDPWCVKTKHDLRVAKDKLDKEPEISGAERDRREQKANELEAQAGGLEKYLLDAYADRDNLRAQLSKLWAAGDPNSDDTKAKAADLARKAKTKDDEATAVDSKIKALRAQADAERPARQSNPLFQQVALRCNPYNGDKPKRQIEILTQTADGANELEALQQSLKNAASKVRPIRAVDLIPRQSSLNVNDIQDKVKNFNLAGAFSWLFGLGARVNFQRQRELYEQFMHQDIYASAFGKGDSEFGWTFGPVPGSPRIAPGLHTTYAVLVIPDDAEVIELEAHGCAFPRDKYAPQKFSDTTELTPNGNPADTTAGGSESVDCSKVDTFRVAVPGTSENNFWVTGIDYSQVKPGQRAVVNIHGDYFSPQIGVLVDGVPLRKAVGVAQVELAATKNPSFQPTPRGEYEFINSKELVLAFTMPDNFKGGTPKISLVTPGRARTINDLRLVINNSYRNGADDSPCDNEPKPGDPRYKSVDNDDGIYVTLNQLVSKCPMFVTDFSVTGVELFRQDATSAELTAYVAGGKFNPTDTIEVNGQVIPDGKKTFHNDGLWEIKFVPSGDNTLTVAVFPKSGNSHGTKTVANPRALTVSGSEVIKYTPKDKKNNGLLVVKLTGSDFNPSVLAFLNRGGKDKQLRFRRISTSEAVVEIDNPDEYEVVTLNDYCTTVTPVPTGAKVCNSVSAVIARPKPPEPAATPAPTSTPTGSAGGNH